ncbi:MAG: hypothetical protein ABEJ62_01295 [Candidatus Nanohaloarchaea archaeon]
MLTEIEFRCDNCGEAHVRDILPMKHAIMGAALKLSRETNCCENPEYIDCSGPVDSLGFIYSKI